MSKLSDFINKEMADRKWKPKDFKRESKLSQATISRLLNGEGEPKTPTLAGVARAFKLSISEVRSHSDDHEGQKTKAGAIIGGQATHQYGEKMSVELIARMYGITNISVALILDRVLNLNKSANMRESIEEIKKRLDILYLEHECESIGKKLESNNN